MLAEYHLFRTKPLEKCLLEKEAFAQATLLLEALHVIDGLRSRMAVLKRKIRMPVQGYVFVDGIPALLIRSDGTLFLFERYSSGKAEILQALEKMAFSLGMNASQPAMAIGNRPQVTA